MSLLARLGACRECDVRRVKWGSRVKMEPFFCIGLSGPVVSFGGHGVLREAGRGSVRTTIDETFLNLSDSYLRRQARSFVPWVIPGLRNGRVTRHGWSWTGNEAGSVFQRVFGLQPCYSHRWENGGGR